MNWFFLALTATSFFILYNLLSRILAIRSTSPRAFTILYNGIAAGLSVCLLVLEPFSIPSLSFEIIALSCVGFIIWALFARMEFLSKKYVEASTLTIIFRLAPLVTVVTSLLFLHEPFTPAKAVAIGCIIIANIILAYNNKRISLRHLGFAVILASSLGLGWIFDKLVSHYYPLSFYTILSFGIPSLLNAITPPISTKEIAKEWKTSTWKIPLLASINIAGYYMYLLALRTGEISKVSIVISSAGIITMILGIWLLKERKMLGRKLCAGVFILLSILLLQ